MGVIKTLLAEPLTKGFDVDDPRTTELRVRILQSKPFVRRIYDEWYRIIGARIPSGFGQVLELGSGSGYLRQFIPGAIHSEVFWCSNANVIADACSLPFPAGSLRAIVMTDVFHHIPRADHFLNEARRCLRSGGRIVMIEPWVSHWSRLIWHVHPEPFLPDSCSWDIPKGGPLSGANIALPWIVFKRDRNLFKSKFPEFEVVEVLPMMPFSFLLSGGLSMRSLLPVTCYGFVRNVEAMLSPWMDQIAMFATFTIAKH